MARKAQELVVGIDVGAKTLHVAVRTLRGKTDRFEVSNDHVGHQALIRRVTNPRVRTRVCIEATSTYGMDLALALIAANVDVMTVNPKATRRFADAKLRRSKTDRIDADDILEYALRMEWVPWAAPRTNVLKLRSIGRRFAALTVDLTAEKNRLHATTATEQAVDIVVEDIRDHITSLEERREKLLKAASDLIASDEELAALRDAITAIKGVGEQTAAIVLGELLVLPLDMTPRQVVAHAGLDPRLKQSGTSVNAVVRVSKVGNARLRAALYFPAQAAIRHEPAFAPFVERLRSRGKEGNLVVVAVMRKLLHVLWAIIRSKSRFNASKMLPRVAAA